MLFTTHHRWISKIQCGKHDPKTPWLKRNRCCLSPCTRTKERRTTIWHILFEIRHHVAPKMDHVILLGPLEMQCWLVVCFNNLDDALARNGRWRWPAFLLCSWLRVSRLYLKHFTHRFFIGDTDMLHVKDRHFHSWVQFSATFLFKIIPRTSSLIIFCSFRCRAHGSLRHGDGFSFVGEKPASLLFSMSGPWQSEAWRWLFVWSAKSRPVARRSFCVLVWSRACFSGTALVNTVPLPDYFWVRGWFCFCGYLPVLVGINKWCWSVLLPFAIGVASSIWWLLWSWSYVPRNLCVTPANDGRSRR